jgi:hypothetical protein
MAFHIANHHERKTVELTLSVGKTPLFATTRTTGASNYQGLDALVRRNRQSFMETGLLLKPFLPCTPQ